MVDEGKPAPDFELTSDNGEHVKLSNFRGKPVVLYMFWRDRMRHEIETWSQRSNRVFYGSALLIIVDFAAYFWPGRRTVGLDAFAFIVVLILAGYAMYRVWRSERTYGY